MVRGACILFTLASVVFASDEAVNPIRKIVTLLQDMQKEIEGDTTKEKELYEKFMCICETSDGELTKITDEASAKIEELKSSLEEEGAEKSQMKQELQEHYRDRDDAEKELGKAQALRDKEKSEFEKNAGDARNNIGALKRSLPALEAGLSSGGGASLAQLGFKGPAGLLSFRRVVSSSNFLTSFDRDRVLAFMDQMGQGREEYNPQSGQIVGILKGMKEEMERNLAEQSKQEVASSQGFAGLKGGKDQEIAVARHSIEAKEERSGALAVSLSQNRDGLEDSTDQLNDAQTMQAQLKKQCTSRKKDWAERTKARTEEVAAISEAIKVLNDDDALEMFKKSTAAAASSSLITVPRRNLGLLQRRKDLIQSEDDLSRAQRAREMVANIVALNHGPGRRASATLHELLLSIDSHVTKAFERRVGQAPPKMDAVIKLLDKMLTMLSKEAEEDEQKKIFCSNEIFESDTEKTARQEELDQIKASMEEMTDTTGVLVEDISNLEKEIQDLDKNVAFSTEQRKKEHAEYLDGMSMQDAAIGLIGKARNRLQKFYNPKLYVAPKKKELSMEEKIVASYGAFQQEFVQIDQHQHRRQLPNVEMPPEMPRYKKSSKSGGVIGLMDTMKHELQMDKQAMEMNEKTSQKDYVTLMAESQQTRVENAKALGDKRKAKATYEAKMTAAKERRVLTLDELQNAHEYLIQLHAQCDFLVENYEARVEARQAELEGLQGAKAAITGQPPGSAPPPPAGEEAPAEAAPAADAAAATDDGAQ